MPEGDMFIKEVGFGDAGKYTCLAENKFGSEKAEGSLIVKDRTKITEKPEDYEVRAGDAATFRCNAVADPDLNLSIDWLTDGKKIDFETEPRFIQQSDFSLSISKTTELDSGSYTCVASTELDEIQETATLIVQDVPNAPKLMDVVCNDKDASVEWQPQGDNRAPILGYIIQYNTSFTSDTWENAFDSVPSTNTKFTVNLSPYANYTFRVIATNKIGPSQPSKHSSVCTTPIAVPNKNPEGVEGKGTNKNNMVIKWSPMPEIEHNGPGFKYRVYWKRYDKPDSTWNTAEVVDWEQDHYVVEGQPTFKKYEIKVEAHNDMGQANVAIPTTIGWSGEDVPSEAPSNLKLDNVYGATTAKLSWDPVRNTSINGHFRGYKIQTWTEDETEAKARDVIIENNDETTAVVESFVPFTRNFARVLVFNGAHDGPPSNTIEFVTPEGTPGPVDSLEAIPMGSSGFFLIWKKPKRPNGVLTGYHIYYRTVEGTELGPQSERDPPIRDPMMTRAKLAALKPDTKYRISIKARTKIGVGSEYYIERKTRATGAAVPGRPSMLWEHVSTQTGAPAIKLTWIPNTDTNPGSHFYAQYRLNGESKFERTKPELYRDYIVLEGLKFNRIYEVRLVAVDGDFESHSQIEEIETYTQGVSTSVIRRPSENIATRGWFIGMMLAIALLLLILIIVCIIKRNRGGKYAVHEREAAHGRSDFPEETGFPEYSQPLDGGKRDSLGSDVKPPVESDTDSMAEYGDGDAGRFTEDGSFIGQYGTGQRGKKKQQQPSSDATTPSNVATFV
ncbi:Fibronectin type III [Trinorchestia longiramus]|nr:Fibronectin type III [Trinorchestia longiramus]